MKEVGVNKGKDDGSGPYKGSGSSGTERSDFQGIAFPNTKQVETGILGGVPDSLISHVKKLLT